VVGLGRETGRFSAVVKGSRKAKSRLAGLLEPPVELIGLLRQGRNQLDNLSQLQLRRGFAGLRQNLDALMTAGFLARLFREALPEHAPLESAYLLFSALHDRLAQGENVTVTALWGQYRLLAELGVEPEIDHCLSCGSAKVEGYSARDGGLLCAACYSGSGFSVSAPILCSLRSLRATPIEGSLPCLQPVAVREIGRIFKQQFQQHLSLPDRVFRPVLPKERS
jgi:DNA repair protein RecO (recombination protein O)